MKLKAIFTCLLAIRLLIPIDGPIKPPFDDYHTLKGSFGFYDGSINMSEIQSITFSRDTPVTYDECWYANLANTVDIMGYRSGADVTIVGDYIYANPRCTRMFAARNSYGDPLWSGLIAIDGLELLDTSHVENMTMMFAGTQVSELEGIDIWDTSNVRSFAAMFQGSDNSGDMLLTELDVGNWDTSSAENMSHMFYGCGLLTYIPVEDWDVSNVTTFSHMFADCYSLRDIDFSKWKTTSVRSFDGFLNDCRSLVEIDVSGLDTSRCEQFSQMFEACVNLERIIGIEDWDVSNASNYAFSETFHYCYKLDRLDLSRWTAEPDNVARMFKGCRSLAEIDISGLKIDEDTVVDEMFDDCWRMRRIE